MTVPPPLPHRLLLLLSRKADIRLLGKENSNSHGMRPVH